MVFSFSILRINKIILIKSIMVFSILHSQYHGADQNNIIHTPVTHAHYRP